MNWMVDFLVKILEVLLADDKPAPTPPPPVEPPVVEPPDIPDVPYSFADFSKPGNVVHDLLTRGDNLIAAMNDPDGAGTSVFAAQYQGKLTDEGLRMRNGRNGAKYYLPKGIREGALSFDVKGLDDMHGISFMLALMFDAADPIGFTQNRYRVNIQKHTPNSTNTKNYLRIRWIERDLEGRWDVASRYNTYDPAKWYTFWLNWDDQSVSLAVNGKTQVTFRKDSSYTPRNHVIVVGDTERGEAYPGAVYRNVRIWAGQFADGAVLPPPPDVVETIWDTFIHEPFGFRGPMKIHNTPNFWAWHAVDTALIWDGVRNPNAAKGYSWKAYRGIPRDQVMANINTCQSALDTLRRILPMKKVPKWEPSGEGLGWAEFDYKEDGPVRSGRMGHDEYMRTMGDIMHAAAIAAAMNGISGISQGDTDGFTF
jgi:hypothetical protein